MEHFHAAALPLMVVDFAHTPEGLRQAALAMREHVEADLWCVFGCGGDRDRGKRAEMGAVAQQHCDHIVLTDDNPRSEDGDAIIADIRGGLAPATVPLVERDRAQAIRQAVARARSGDGVLIAGKGHEAYQIVGQEQRPYSDQAVVRQIIDEVAA